MLIRADARSIPLTDGCVQCCVTSPPYWGAQRDYGVSGQVGMEKEPRHYIAALLAVFSEVRRVLRKDGCLWINIGDAYAASGKGGGGSMMRRRHESWSHRAHLKGWRKAPPGYKEKDLVGVPWMLAFALRDAGWYLRRDVVWDKGIATEPPRADRPSGSHEMLFLFSKQQDYRFDPSRLPHGTVWRVPPSGSYEDHHATYPEKLIEPCILAGCPEGGLVLDPFIGSGTTGAVCDRLMRRWVGLDLTYQHLSRTRTAQRGLQFISEATA